MQTNGSFRFGLTPVYAVLLVAFAQPQAPPAQAPVAPSSLEDRVVSLVQAGKCARAKEEATKGGNDSLADQVSAMCGAKSSGGSSSGGEGHGRRGGGGRGGRGSQGGAPGD